MPRFSVLIVTYNSSEAIVPCLRSIAAGPESGNSAEVIIVDNASVDDTTSLVRNGFPGVRLIENNRNSGFAAAVNQAAAIANGEFLLILNPDTVVNEGFFAGLMKFFASHAEAGVAGCRIVDAAGNQIPSVWHDPSFGTVACEVFLPYNTALKLITGTPGDTRRVDMVSGACMAVRREVFQRLGGFDKRFFMYYEDADFCLRTRRDGFSVYFLPQISAFHGGGGSTKDRDLFYQRIWKSKMMFLKKHRNPLSYLITLAMVVVGISLRIACYFSLGTIMFSKPLMRLGKSYSLALSAVLSPGT